MTEATATVGMVMDSSMTQIQTLGTTFLPYVLPIVFLGFLYKFLSH